MDLDRRSFLKVLGVTAGGVLLPSGAAWAGTAPDAPVGSQKGMLSDLTRCIGCGWCQQACKEWNQLDGCVPCPGSKDACLSAQNWTLLEYKEIERNGQIERIFVKRQCMHCLDPACVSACPVGALQKQESGAVTYDPSRCIGCRYCMVACPFGVPTFDWDQTLPMICKCQMCVDRQDQGMIPACAGACPTGALTFGNRDDLIDEAMARVQAEPDRYVNHLYGLEEIGGTSWMYLSPVPFEELGFPALKTEPVTTLSESVATYGTAGMAVGVSALLGAAYFFFHRQEGAIMVEEPVVDGNEGGES